MCIWLMALSIVQIWYMHYFSVAVINFNGKRNVNRKALFWLMFSWSYSQSRLGKHGSGKEVMVDRNRRPVTLHLNSGHR